MRTVHTQQHARSEYHTQLAKMSFDKIFDLTAGVHLYFYNTCCSLYRTNSSTRCFQCCYAHHPIRYLLISALFFFLLVVLLLYTLHVLIVTQSRVAANKQAFPPQEDHTITLHNKKCFRACMQRCIFFIQLTHFFYYGDLNVAWYIIQVRQGGSPDSIQVRQGGSPAVLVTSI